eukprot:g14042.t1
MFLLSGRACLYDTFDNNPNIDFESLSKFEKYYLFFRGILVGARNGDGLLFHKSIPWIFQCFVAMGEKRSNYRLIAATLIENFKLHYSAFGKQQLLYNRFIKLVDCYVARDTFVEFYNWLMKRVKISTEDEFFAVADSAWTCYIIQSNFLSNIFAQQISQNKLINKNRRSDLILFYHLFQASNKKDNLWEAVENRIERRQFDVENQLPIKIKEKMELWKQIRYNGNNDELWEGVERPEAKIILPEKKDRKLSNMDILNFESDEHKKKLEKYVKHRKFVLLNTLERRKSVIDLFNAYKERHASIETDGLANTATTNATPESIRRREEHFQNNEFLLNMAKLRITR